jgi:hypothetical protein
MNSFALCKLGYFGDDGFDLLFRQFIQHGKNAVQFRLFRLRQGNRGLCLGYARTP